MPGSPHPFSVHPADDRAVKASHDLLSREHDVMVRAVVTGLRARRVLTALLDRAAHRLHHRARLRLLFWGENHDLLHLEYGAGDDLLDVPKDVGVARVVKVLR